MMFGIFSRCDSMAETCEGLRAMSGKLNHLDLEKSPAKSSAGDGLRNRSNEFFEALYYQLIKRYASFLSDSRTNGLTFKELYIVDSAGEFLDFRLPFYISAFLFAGLIFFVTFFYQEKKVKSIYSKWNSKSI